MPVFIGCIALSPPVFAQKQINTLEYWIDGSSNSRIHRSIGAVSVNNWEEMINLSALTDGVHTFNSRFKDISGVWTNVQSHFFLKQTNAAGQGLVRKVNGLEYWIDGKSSSRTQRTLSGATPYNWEELLDYSTLNDGVHTFNVRFRDDGGVWTHAQSHFFLKQTNAAGQGLVRKVNGLEYWIDGKSTSRTQRALFAATPYNWEEQLDYSALNDGVHTFNVRFRDDGGVWTNTQSHFFLKQTNAAGQGLIRKINGLEYWIDGKSTSRTQRTLSAATPYNWEEQLDYSALNDGVHTFNVRFKDDGGVWTNTQSYFFIKIKRSADVIPIGENRITGYRVWFAEEPGFIPTFSTNVSPGIADVQDSVPLSFLPKGKHQIAYQFKDKRGVWSPVITDSITQNGKPDFSFTADKNSVMLGQSVKLTPRITLFIDSIVWSYGDGVTEVYFEPVHTYKAPGQFDVTATVWHKGSHEGIAYIEVKYIKVISSGVPKVEVVTLKIYPVPTNDVLSVETEMAAMKEISIISLNGTIIQKHLAKIRIKSNYPLGISRHKPIFFK